MARTQNDWLADDEGNLRPEVARILSDAPLASDPRRAIERAARPPVPLDPAVPRWLPSLACWVCGVVLALRIVGCWQDTHRPLPVVLSQPASTVSAPTPMTEPSPTITRSAS